MFNKDFYPTPKNVCAILTKDLRSKTGNSNDIRILEPSAGKGDIIDYIHEKYEYYQMKLDLIEIEPELRAILREKYKEVRNYKNTKIVDNDFLNYKSFGTYDFIIMNPPFSNGLDHFLKAWDIANNTEIRCLLNYDTIMGNTEKAKLIRGIVEENGGTIEELGPVFKGSERTTGVNIGYINVFRKAAESFDFSFKPEAKDTTYDFSYNPNKNALGSIDMFEDYEFRFNKACEIYSQMIKLGNEFQYYANTVYTKEPDDINFNIVSGGIGTFNRFFEIFKRGAWNQVFIKTKLRNMLTRSVVKKLEDIQRQQSSMSFTKQNMEQLLSDLFYNKNAIMKTCVEDCFDMLTKYHKENRCHIEGWKTNKRWYVNRKIILPYAIQSFGSNYYLHYDMKGKIDDLEKAMCFISGISYESDKFVSLTNCMSTHMKGFETGKWYEESTFFRGKAFKKGTIHLEFKDENLWKKFNIEATADKNWVGCD